MIDLSKVRFDKSENQYPPALKNSCEFIVMHAMVGSYSGSESWFHNKASHASAHYLVSQKGEVVQMVKDECEAWHAYGLNARSIGIEMEDKGQCEKNAAWITPALWQTAVDLAAALCKKHNIPVTKILMHSDPFIQNLAVAARHPNFVHHDPGKFWNHSKFRAEVDAKLKATK